MPCIALSSRSNSDERTGPVRVTHTYSTCNIVIIAGEIYVEDFSMEPDRVAQEAAHTRPFRFIDHNHFRRFVDHEGENAMTLFTCWLHEVGAVVGKWWNLPETLTEEERDGA